MNKTKKILMLMLTLIMFASALAFSASAANAPSAPATLTATQNTSAIKLTWSKVSGATGYRIYYKLPADLSWRTAVSSTTSTSHIFKNLPDAQPYTFAVRSYTKTSTGTVWGGYKQIQVATNAYAPRTLNANQSENSISLYWSEVKKADGYRIYYKKTGTQKWKIAVSNTQITSHEFTGLSSGIKYDFAVRPYIRNVKNAKSVFWGNYKTISTATEPAPPATVNVQKNEQAKTVTISWSKVKGADCYRVYYRPVYYNIFPIGDFKTAVDATTSTKCTLKWDGGSYEIAIMPMIKTASGTICGSKAYGGINYNSSSGNSSTTGPTYTTTHPTTTAPTTEPQERRIELTLDNWDEYFEVYEEVYWNENAFDEPTEFSGIKLYFALKDEYLNKCDAEFACEYSINTVDCEVKYDVNNEKIEILSTSNPRGEHLSTFRGYAYNNYLEYSPVDAKDKKGIIEFEKYNFLGVTRINGYIEFYD